MTDSQHTSILSGLWMITAFLADSFILALCACAFAGLSLVQLWYEK